MDRTKRLTDKSITQAAHDAWEVCGLDHVCKRDCYSPTPCTIPKMIYKLEEYETYDEQGRLFITPSSIGQKVFLLIKNVIIIGEVYKIEIEKLRTIIHISYRTFTDSNDNSKSIFHKLIVTEQDYGKTVFTDRRALEEALKNES